MTWSIQLATLRAAVATLNMSHEDTPCGTHAEINQKP